jgi:hypothetical protein
MTARTDQKAQWIRDRLDYANLAYHARNLERLDAQRQETNRCFEAQREAIKAELVTLCPLCGAAVLNDGTFEACASCPEPR